MVTLFGTNKSKQKGFMQMTACTYGYQHVSIQRKKLIIQKQVHVELEPMFFLEGVGRRGQS
jgi:hypothetical protein